MRGKEWGPRGTPRPVPSEGVRPAKRVPHRLLAGSVRKSIMPMLSKLITVVAATIASAAPVHEAAAMVRCQPPPAAISHPPLCARASPYRHRSRSRTFAPPKVKCLHRCALEGRLRPAHTRLFRQASLLLSRSLGRRRRQASSSSTRVAPLAPNRALSDSSLRTRRSSSSCCSHSPVLPRTASLSTYPTSTQISSSTTRWKR